MVFSVIKSLTLSPGPLSLMITPNRELWSLSVLGLPRPLSPGTRQGEWGCELTSKFPAQVGGEKLILSLKLVSLQVEPRTKALPTEADTLASFPGSSLYFANSQQGSGWWKPAGPESACFFLLSYYWL